MANPDETTVFAVMPRLDGQDFFSVMNTHTFRSNIDHIGVFAINTLLAVAELSDIGIIHGDLKPGSWCNGGWGEDACSRRAHREHVLQHEHG